MQCARDIQAGDVRSILERSSFYPPLVLCLGGVAMLLGLSDAAAGGAVMIAFLGLGMAAVYLLGRRLAGGSVGVGGRAALRQRALHGVLHAALPARPAAGRRGRRRARGAARHGPLHAHAGRARLRRRLRPRHADQADVRALRAGAGGDGAGPGRTGGPGQRGARHAGGGGDQPALVWAAPVRAAGPARRAGLWPGGGIRASGSVERGRRDLLPANADARVRHRGRHALRRRPARGGMATPVAPARLGPGPVRRARRAHPEQEPPVHAAAARRHGGDRRAGAHGVAARGPSRRGGGVARARRAPADSDRRRRPAELPPAGARRAVGVGLAADADGLAARRDPGAAGAGPRAARRRR